MPGYILHLTEARMITDRLEERGYHLSPEWKNRFQLGCLLPDTKEKREKAGSHFWNPDHMNRQAIAPDMSRFLEKYEKDIRGPLMLGYRTHLMLDALFVNEFWNRTLEFQDRNGKPAALAADIHYVLLKNTGERILKEHFFTKEYYYGDYTRMNAPLQRKYGITFPHYEEDLTCPVEEADLHGLKQILTQLDLLAKQGTAAEKESLRVFRREQLEEFLRTSAEEASEYICSHLNLLALDLDGTLLHSDKSLSPKSRQILCQAIKEGHQIIVASGRPFGALPENVLSIPGVRYAITSNGVSVYDLHSEKNILHTPMTQEAAEAVLGLAEGKNGILEILYDGDAYTTADFIRNPKKYGVGEHGVAYIQSTRIPVEDPAAFAREHISELDAIDLLTPDPEDRKNYLDQLSRIPHLYVTSSLPRLIEISAEGAGKGKALTQLAQILGQKQEQIIAFGNEENDLDLFHAAGTSVAVENSPDIVKRSADIITGPNDEDGVAECIERLLLHHP